MPLTKKEPNTVLLAIINHNGGYQVANEPDTFKYVPKGNQLKLDF